MSWSEARRARKGSPQRTGKPFARLVSHSIERVMNGGDESGEIDFGIGAMLALLAAPGAFASIVASQSDEYFFVVLAMVAAGAVAVWKWDALIPGRRDYVNLAPLPIPARHLLYANLAAVLLLAAALGFDVNAASSVMYPLAVGGSQWSFGYTAIFFATHLLSVFLASIFSFFIALAILGLMMAVLPYRVFRRCSVYVRCGMVVFLMAVLSTTFEMSAIVQHPSPRLGPLVQFLPPVWFLGLCQRLRGMTDPMFATLAETALFASFGAMALAIGAYALSYRRCFTESSESIANFAAVGGAMRHTGRRRITDLFLRTPFERGCFLFTLKTLFRSENHKLIVGGFAGVGIVLVSETLFQSASAGGTNRWPSAALLGIPLIVLYFLLIGLRYSFEIPVMLKGNWIFQLTNANASECVGLARKIMLMFLILPAFAIVLPAYGFVWGWRIGVIHAAVVAAASMVLIEILLVQFRKIPFTCSSAHFKSILVSSFFCFAGFMVFTSWVPIVEQRASDDPLWYLGFILTLTATWVGLALYRREMARFDSRPIFEERSDVGDVAVEVLNLSRIAREVPEGGTVQGTRVAE